MRDVFTRYKLAREAMYVDRCHTFMKIGTYPVGMHTFGMLIALRILYPNASIHLIWAILEHDVPERLISDVPRGAKPFILDLDNYHITEKEVMEFIFGNNNFPLLTDNEKRWLTGLDVLEFYHYCLDQRSLGNQNYKRKIEAIEDLFVQCADLFPQEVVNFYYKSRAEGWDFQGDLLDHGFVPGGS